MRTFVPPPRLRSPAGRTTRWMAVADALRKAIDSGRLVGGEWLPSTRALGATFDVHRHTAQLAVDALAAEGLLEVLPRRGARVAAQVHAFTLSVAAPARSGAERPFPGFRIRPDPDAEKMPPLTPGLIALHAALPDASLLPLAELRAAYGDALRRQGAAHLGALEAWGEPRLRAELRRYLRRARSLVPGDLVLTHGSQEAVALVAQVLVSPGDVVAVEDPGYLPVREMFESLGAEIAPIAVDAQGLRVEELKALLRRRTVRCVYVTPNHQYPTTVSMSVPRRAALLEATRRHGVPIVEDDYDHEYHYQGVPQAPLASWPGASHVLYVATLSKLVAPAVRLGLLAGDRAVLEAVVHRRRLTSRANDGITQAALASWMHEGGFERHLRRARRVYAERREAALRALAAAARKVSFSFDAPAGGLAIWTHWPDHDVLALARHAYARGVLVLPEAALTRRADAHGMRLAFGHLEPARFAQGLHRLVAAAQMKSARPPR